MNNTKSVKKTLLLSILFAAPSPFVVGFALLIGKSSTQIADFVRRTSELIAIIAAYVTYIIISKDENIDKKQKLKIETNSSMFVGLLLMLAGTVMFIIALTATNKDKGNIIPALIIALSGVTSNTYFFIKYKGLYKKDNSPILEIQSKLYLSKCIVDTFVSIPLTIILISPQSNLANIFDIFGSSIVALYLIFSGLKTVVEKIKIKLSMNL